MDRKVDDDGSSQADQVMNHEGKNQGELVIGNKHRDETGQAMGDKGRGQTRQAMDDDGNDPAVQGIIHEGRNPADYVVDDEGRDQLDQTMDVEVGAQVDNLKYTGVGDQVVQAMVNVGSNEAEPVMGSKERDQAEQVMKYEAICQVHQVMDVEDRDQAEQILIDEDRNEAKSVMDKSGRDLVEQLMEEEVSDQVQKVIDVADKGRAEQILVHDDSRAEPVVGNADRRQAHLVMEDGAAKQGERVLDFNGRNHAEQRMDQVVEDGAANQSEQMMDHNGTDHPEQSMNDRDRDQAMQAIDNGGRAQEEQVKDNEDGEQADQLKIGPEFVSAMLKDGSLSVEGLASKGFYVMEDDDDSDESCSSSSSSSSDGDTEEGTSGGNSDGASSDSEDEIKTISQKKAVQNVKDELNEFEDTEAPRTKHELQVLPRVPKVTAALEPHHQTVCIGHITSVLDLTVIVEAVSDQRILNEQSVLWMEESRMPLGFVDEIFGPVKNPYYLVRFNESEEIPADAKVGSAVSYVSEFSEFVLKENPELYKRAVDASGLDDEELGSGDDQEFSDDEKEAVARRMNKSKRGNGSGETRPGQGLNKSKTKGTNENVRSGAGDAPLRNRVDSIVSQKSASWQPSGPGLPRSRRHRNHQLASRSSSQNSDQGQSSCITEASEATRPADGFNASPSSMRGEPRHQSIGGAYSPQRHGMQLPSPQTPAQWQMPGMGGPSPYASRGIPALPGQGFPIQQQGSTYPPHPYGSVPGASQFSPQRQGNPFASSPASQMHMPAATFNAGMDPSSFTQIPGHGLINPSFPGYHPGYVPGHYNRSPMGQGMSAQHGFREMQPGGYPPSPGTGAALPYFGSGFQPQGYRSQHTGPYAFQSQAPPIAGDDSAFHHGQRGNQPPYPRRKQMDRSKHRR